MAPRAKCPKCGNVRIDKGTLRKSTSGTEIIWIADCPKCGQALNSKNLKPYPIPEEDSFIPLQEDSEEIKYNTKKNKA